MPGGCSSNKLYLLSYHSAALLKHTHRLPAADDKPLPYKY